MWQQTKVAQFEMNSVGPMGCGRSALITVPESIGKQITSGPEGMAPNMEEDSTVAVAFGF